MTRIVVTAEIRNVVSCRSARLLEGLQRPPPEGEPVAHSGCELDLAGRDGTDRGRYLGHGLVGAQRTVVEQVHQAAVVKLDQGMRMELLQPRPDLLELGRHGRRIA